MTYRRIILGQPKEKEMNDALYRHNQLVANSARESSDEGYERKERDWVLEQDNSLFQNLPEMYSEEELPF